jgi:hypothetical protein
MTRRVRFTAHAATWIAERGIEPGWIESVLQAPAWQAADPLDPSLTRSFGPVEPAGGRLLRFVHRDDGHDILVVTAHSDCGARR